MSLKNKAINGAFWKIAERTANQVIQFGVGIFLARMIAPSEYGTVGVLAIFFALGGVFQNCGFGTALIQKIDRTDDDYSTVFIFNVASSIIIYIILYLTAPIIADFYNIPELTAITRVSSLSFIISGLTGIQYSKLNIEMRFDIISKLSILGHALSGVVGLTLAYLGLGVWALVFQGLISSLITGVVLWYVSKWTPAIRFSYNSFKSLFKFGGNMLGSNLINVIYGNLYTLVIGKFFAPSEVGMYNRANGYASLPANICSELSVGVNFPILATLQNDNDKLLSAYEKLLIIPYYVLYPILIGLIVCATPLITVMIGDSWLPCVPYLQILCVGYMFYPLNGFNMNLLYVKGRSDLALKLDFIKKPIGLALLFLSIPWGIMWMMIGKAAYSIIVYSMNCYYTKKILSYGLTKQLKVLNPYLMQSLIMGAVVYVAMYYIEGDVSKIAVGIPLGIIIYICESIVFKNKAFFEIKNIITSKIKKNDEL